MDRPTAHNAMQVHRLNSNIDNTEKPSNSFSNSITAGSVIYFVQARGCGCG